MHATPNTTAREIYQDANIAVGVDGSRRLSVNSDLKSIRWFVKRMMIIKMIQYFEYCQEVHASFETSDMAKMTSDNHDIHQDSLYANDSFFDAFIPRQVIWYLSTILISSFNK
jgi:hypothetical protein